MNSHSEHLWKSEAGDPMGHIPPNMWFEYARLVEDTQGGRKTTPVDKL